MPHQRENYIPWSVVLQYEELLYIDDVCRNVVRRKINKDEKGKKLLEKLEQENTKEKGPYFLDNGIIGKTDIDKQGQQRNRVVLPEKYMIPILINIHKIKHPGSHKLASFVNDQIVFLTGNIRKESMKIIRACHKCNYQKRIKSSTKRVFSEPDQPILVIDDVQQQLKLTYSLSITKQEIKKISILTYW